ncbi:polyprenyl synthetase family protein [Carnobacterium gallinarum]|uniref:polyprenyl synthetase family protein n=1 Tax=Carnobacterium gallinarum TaxID=2749 RepID=UPI0005531435
MTLDQFKMTMLPKLEETLKQQLAENMPADSTLYQAMNYSVEAGGKRIRPLLLLATIQVLSGNVESGLLVATALEYIHTYSLIHDDLPAMDDDALRRGKPTNHIVYGEALAILAGDGLLTYAFELVGESPFLTNQQRVKLVVALAKAAGPTGMVLGQVADIEGEDQQLPLSELQKVHQKKTGELLKFAAYAGAVIANADTATEKSLVEFASHIGLAFQIRDDILDVIGTTAELGKETGMDTIHQKSTYPNLLTLDGAKEALNLELNLARKSIIELEQTLAIDTSLLSGFIELLEI